MKEKTIAFIGRAARFSPDGVDKDLAILAAVRQKLQVMGFSCLDIVNEEGLMELPEANAYVSMARGGMVLDLLAEKDAAGKLVVNSTPAVMLCNYRSLLMNTMQCEDVPVPPLTGTDGYWVKRGFGCRESAADVQYAADRETALQLRDQMLSRGIAAVDVRAHVVGDWLKFYGVAGTDFFYTYYPEGKAKNKLNKRMLLRKVAWTVADIDGLTVYGGDCIIREDGTPVLIDLNDWPSFSPCREEAAKAIAEQISEILNDMEEEDC